MRLLLCAYFTLAAAAFSLAAAGPLDQWQREIEETGAQVAVIRVATDPERQEMRLAGEAPHRPVIVSYLMNERFRAELVNAHALTVTHRAAGGVYHFVVLNLARAAEWQPHQEGLMAHELGHIWLESQGLAGLPFSGGDDACVAVHANDIVQHVLIRAESRRRQINDADYWLAKLLPLVRSLEEDKPAAPLPPCGQLTLLSHWLDARLGTAVEDWQALEPLAARFAARHPDLAPVAERVEAALRPVDLTDPGTYRKALAGAYGQLRDLYQRLAPPPPAEFPAPGSGEPPASPPGF